MKGRELISERKQKFKRILALIIMAIFLLTPVAVLAEEYHGIWYDSDPLDVSNDFYVSYCDVSTDSVSFVEGDRLYRMDSVIYSAYGCENEVINPDFVFIFYEDGEEKWTYEGTTYYSARWGIDYSQNVEIDYELTYRQSYMRDDGVPVLEFDYYYDPVDDSLDGELLEVGHYIQTDVSADKYLSIDIDTTEVNPHCSYPVHFHQWWPENDALGIEREESTGSDYYTIVGYENEGINLDSFLGWKMIDRAQWADSSSYELHIELVAVCKNSIVYILDGGENDESNPSTYETNEGVRSFAPASKEGMRFVGWYTDENYTDEIVDIEVGTEGPVYLYAKYESDEPEPEPTDPTDSTDPTDPTNSDDQTDSGDTADSGPISIVAPQTKDSLLSSVTVVCLCGVILTYTVYRTKLR